MLYIGTNNSSRESKVLSQKNIYTSIGLMSGTSLDGVDSAIIQTDGDMHIKFIQSGYMPYNQAFKDHLYKACRQDMPLYELLSLEEELTGLHAKAVKHVLKEAGLKADDVDIIGFHGQTIRHLPEEGITHQLGNGPLLKEQTGIRVAYDFRKADMAAGGEGAPLVPVFHQALFANHKKPVGVVNIGGVSNITRLGENGQMSASDCGPGMGLLDRWVQSQTGQAYDDAGALAQQGTIDMAVVERAFDSIPFFKSPPPKSADRYDFDNVDVSHLSVEDGAATLCALTAHSIIETAKAMPQEPKELWLTGGGAKNQLVLDLLAQHFDKVKPVEDANMRGESMEAEAFAYLAVRCLKGWPATWPETTGCAHPVCGGILTP